jgi:hypothetical protein
MELNSTAQVVLPAAPALTPRFVPPAAGFLFGSLDGFSGFGKAFLTSRKIREWSSHVLQTAGFGV